MDPNIFLLSSFDPVPQHDLRGICWQGEDLIIGNKGYKKYRAAQRAEIQPGQDGSYIIVNTYREEAVIGTDFSGYYKLFLYQRGEKWALSNSFIELVRYTASRNLPVTIDENHLSSFFIPGPFGDQLTSLRTSVKEIRLIPSTMEAVLTKAFFGTALTLRPVSTASGHALNVRSYREALQDYLRLWVGRMATVLKSGLYVRSDLTGGRDSRAVLSLMLAAARNIGSDFIRQINFTSEIGAKGDFALACQIAERFQLRFMDKREDLRVPIRLDTSEAYEKWKSLCLGVYGPIYFPVTRPVPTALSFGGAGGEGHRRFYPSVPPNRFLNQQRGFFPSSAQFKRLKRDILEDLSSLRHGTEASVDPMIVHYRHFRDRCHGGRAPQYGNLISPLSGANLRWASSLCSPDQIERSQVLADILINANRELATMPYDEPGKSFDTRHLAEVPDAQDAIRSARNDGQVFASEAASLQAGDFTKQKALRMLREDFLSHYERVQGSGFFPREYLEKARATAENASAEGRFPHARTGGALSHVILAGELSRLSN
ncbi:hypothetical protein [Microvirga terrestris]|uniref:Asparagine synthetase domain-containing protein n=1 Tax=Microvirga terrestris TaxID=2791024 RepID=A0ABS0HWG7_9HYPH|nr:hypothetical protein [Microvirga terrestris]MBF9197507.1 hypothetical protein [Microvirga terrestris]